jgi:hypothetical protein
MGSWKAQCRQPSLSISILKRARGPSHGAWVVLAHQAQSLHFIGSPHAEEFSRAPLRLPSCPLDPVIDLVMTGLNSQLPRSKMRRTLDDPIARKDVPTPKAWFDLLHIVINGAMFH